MDFNRSLVETLLSAMYKEKLYKNKRKNSGFNKMIENNILIYKETIINVYKWNEK